jgi:hypothetical protein
MKLVVDLSPNGFWSFDMKIISHRGNLNGPNPLRENSPEYIEEALSQGFDVEIDVRYDNKDKCFYLGHDEPQYVVSLYWLSQYRENLWVHCKNLEALSEFSKTAFNYFWHETDRYTLTSKGIGWVLVGQYPYSKSVIVLPESISLYSFPHGIEYIKNSYGICTDKPLFYKKIV